MELKMTIQGRLVDKLPLMADKCRDQNYIDDLKKVLAARHQRLISENNQRVTFFIEVLYGDETCSQRGL